MKVYIASNKVNFTIGILQKEKKSTSAGRKRKYIEQIRRKENLENQKHREKRENKRRELSEAEKHLVKAEQNMQTKIQRKSKT